MERLENEMHDKSYNAKHYMFTSIYKSLAVTITFSGAFGAM